MGKSNFTVKLVADATCAANRKQQLYWDRKTPGLGLRVTAGGAKSYIFETSLNNKTLRLTIGDVRTWSVGKAQTEATRLKTLTDQDIDPRELARERQEAEAAKVAAQAAALREVEDRKHLTLRALLDAYVRHLEVRNKTRSAASTRSAFKCHVLCNEEVANTLANQVTSRQVAALVRKVQEAGKVRAAGMLRSYISAAYNAAKKAPFSATLPAEMIPFRIESNPAEAVPAIPVVAGNRRLSPDELKAYMSNWGDSLADQALRVALFSGGQRMAQLLRAKTADFEKDAKILRLLDPKGKRSTPREHLLPLAPKAAALVARLVKRAEKNRTVWLFAAHVEPVGLSEEPGTLATHRETLMAIETPGKRVADICLAMAGEPFDLRDIRRTCETMLAGMGISKDTRAQLLSHGISGLQSTHYDRHDYLVEKRAALRAWEARLRKIAKSKDGADTARSTEKARPVATRRLVRPSKTKDVDSLI